MNEIKCPVCGSAAVTALSEEQYLCEACGNKFQKHNQSKEFQKTDAHIEEIHKDLIKRIEELKADQKANNSSINSGILEKLEGFLEDSEDLGDLEDYINNLNPNELHQLLYENAFHLIEIGEKIEAEEEFESLCRNYSMNYESWYGLILLKTNNFSKEQSWDVLMDDDFWDKVAKMRMCKDYPKEVEEKLNEFFDQFSSTDDLDYVRDQITDLRSKVSEQVQKRMKIINLSKWIVLVIAEWIAFGWAFAWIGKSIQIITAPLPDPASEKAGARLGSAILNFFAIPVKGIIGIAIVVLIYFVIRSVYRFVMEDYWEKSEKQLAALNPNFSEALGQASEWFGDKKKSIELIQMIKTETDNRIHFAEKMAQQIKPEFVNK